MRSRNLLRTTLQGAAELLLFFPVALFAFIYLAAPSGIPLWVWLAFLLVCYPIGLLVGLAGNRLPRVLVFLGLLIVSAALDFVLMSWLPSVLAYAADGTVGTALAWTFATLTGLLMLFLTGRGARMARLSWEAVFPSVCYAAGLVSFFLFSALSRVVEDWKSYSSLVWWIGLIAVLASLLLTNRSHLIASAYSGASSDKPAASIRSQNTMWTVAIFAIALAAAAFSQIKDALVTAFLASVRFVFWLIQRLFPGGKEDVQPPQQQDTPPQMLPMPQGEPSRFAQIMEKVLFVLMYAGVIIGALFVIYWIVRKLIPLVRVWVNRLMERWGLGQAADHDRSGYVDEKTNLMDWADVPGAWGRSLRDRLAAMLEREPKWEDMPDNRERVRFLYRQTVSEAAKKGYKWQKSHTPLETIDDVSGWHAGRESSKLVQADGNETVKQKEAGRSLSAAYEEARYGSGDISDERVAKLRKR